MPHAAALGKGAGASGYKASSLEASLQTSSRTVYCRSTLPNALFIQLFYLSTNVSLIHLKENHNNSSILRNWELED